MTAYGVHGSIRAAEGHGDQLAELLLEASTRVDARSGCRLYLVSRAEDDADLIWVTEVWTGRDAHAASLQDPGTVELITRARPIIAGMGDRTEFVPIGAAGITIGT